VVVTLLGFTVSASTMMKRFFGGRARLDVTDEGWWIAARVALSLHLSSFQELGGM